MKNVQGRREVIAIMCSTTRAMRVTSTETMGIQKEHLVVGIGMKEGCPKVAPGFGGWINRR